MAYTRRNWIEGETPLSAENMNNIEDGLEQALSFGREEAIDLLYPVGTIYFTTSNRNPSEIFNRGTWLEWGSGRVPIGVNASDTDFNVAEKTGGLKTHSHTNPSTGSTALTIDQMPAHTHSMRTEFVSGREILKRVFADSGQGGNMGVTGSTGGGQGHNHTMGNTGASSSLQPYITCYMWKRIG